MTPDEEDEHIFVRCPICEAAEKGRHQNHNPRKFLIDAGGLHAICCECSYRIEIPKLNAKAEEKQNGI